MDKGGKEGRKLIINGAKLNSPYFDGKFYPGRKLTIESKGNNDEYKVTGWKVKVYTGNKSTEETMPGEILDLTMPLCTRIEIESIVEQVSTGIDEIMSDDIDELLPYRVFDLSGRYVGDNLDNLHNGVYILKQGAKSVKRVISSH